MAPVMVAEVCIIMVANSTCMVELFLATIPKIVVVEFFAIMVAVLICSEVK